MSFRPNRAIYEKSVSNLINNNYRISLKKLSEPDIRLLSGGIYQEYTTKTENINKKVETMNNILMLKNIIVELKNSRYNHGGKFNQQEKDR